MSSKRHMRNAARPKGAACPVRYLSAARVLSLFIVESWAIADVPPHVVRRVDCFLFGGEQYNQQSAISQPKVDDT